MLMLIHPRWINLRCQSLSVSCIRASTTSTMNNTELNLELDQTQAASRFITEEDLEVKRAAEDEEWRAAYARIGQEPPVETKSDEVHDTRTLYEKLKAAETAKTEEWDEKMKLGNQYRGLHDEELRFLNDTEEKKRNEEKRIKQEESDELQAYHKALAAKQNAPPPEFSPPSETPPIVKKPVVGKPVRKDVKSFMKGVVVKKKPKVAPAPVVKPSANAREPEMALRKRSLTPEDKEVDKKQKTGE